MTSLWPCVGLDQLESLPSLQARSARSSITRILMHPFEDPRRRLLPTRAPRPQQQELSAERSEVTAAVSRKLDGPSRPARPLSVDVQDVAGCLYSGHP